MIKIHPHSYAKTLFFIDVSFAAIGYVMTLRLTGTHIRSVEPTLLGWAVALVCYQPFWSLIGSHYFAYQTALPWGAWLWEHPVVYGSWGSAILILIAIYASCTAMFGCRFSNLTHRGILTNGPYAWTKHPAYLTKNLSWWLISVPFIAQGSALEAAQKCLLLLGVNGIYFMRARTEERHLSLDPDYVLYSDWIRVHGLFARLRRVKALGAPHTAARGARTHRLDGA